MPKLPNLPHRTEEHVSETSQKTGHAHVELVCSTVVPVAAALPTSPNTVAGGYAHKAPPGGALLSPQFGGTLGHAIVENNGGLGTVTNQGVGLPHGRQSVPAVDKTRKIHLGLLSHTYQYGRL